MNTSKLFLAIAMFARICFPHPAFYTRVVCLVAFLVRAHLFVAFPAMHAHAE